MRITKTSYVILGCFLFLIDRFFKQMAVQNPDFNIYLVDKWLGWEFFANYGIAFSLPIAGWAAAIVTPLALFFLIFLLIKNKYAFVAIVLLSAGALSNFFDRVVWGFTIDYLRAATMIFNLSDVLIFCSVLIVLSPEIKKKICWPK